MSNVNQIDPATLSQSWQRLRWAREQWQVCNGVKPSAQAAAQSMGINPHTYRTYEGPPGRSRFSPLNHQHAIQFGQAFGVSWHWLLTGEGKPYDEELTITQQRIVDAIRDMPVEKQQAIADIVERLITTM